MGQTAGKTNQIAPETGHEDTSHFARQKYTQLITQWIESTAQPEMRWFLPSAYDSHNATKKQADQLVAQIPEQVATFQGDIVVTFQEAVRWSA